MTQEEKQLLLQDLCTRLPYGVKVTWNDKYPLTVTPHIYCAIVSENNINNLPKLLLRPMSSMTEEEKKIQKDYIYHFSKNSLPNYEGDFVFEDEAHEYIDWLNEHHFDYRGLIKKGLAVEAPEGMYGLKENKL